VTVNCATIPKDLAERLLFGTVKGAYSGATSDAEGYLQAAHRGTLFLDEVAELEPGIQAKLLRVLETREVVPLGGTRPHPVDIGLCTATLRDLRDAVASGGFREDLYYRIGRPEVHLPPLRERPEEIPFLVEQAARSSGSKAGAPLVEACLLRPWPGNIRELSTEVRAAAALAVAEGSDLVEPRHLAPQAGQRILSQRPPQGIPAHDAPQGAPSPPPEDLLRAVTETLALARKTALKLLPAGSLAALAKRIEEEKPGEQERAALLRACAAEALLSMLEAQDFNQSAVAVALGTSRTTLIKLMDELALPRATDLPPEQVTAALRESRGDPEAAARLLRVSSSALKKRLSALSMKV
jgi:transcriptional regulator with PAS, ATPase and Fis domain